MPQGFEVDTLSPENISTVAADVGAEMIDFDDTTHDAAFVQFEVDTDNTFPSPTELPSDVDIGFISQNNQVLKRSDDLMPDTDYFIRAQAENVVYSDDTLFSSAAKNSQGFINDISDKDLTNAAAEPLASEAMTQFTNSRTNLLTYSNVLNDFWSLDSPTQAFWNNGSFNQDNTSFGLWQADIDFTSVSNLNIKLRGGGELGSTLNEEQSFTDSEFMGGNGSDILYSQSNETLYVMNLEKVHGFDATTLSQNFEQKYAKDSLDQFDEAIVNNDGNLVIKYRNDDFSRYLYEVDPSGTVLKNTSIGGPYGDLHQKANGDYIVTRDDEVTIYDSSFSEKNNFTLLNKPYNNQCAFGEDYIYILRDNPYIIEQYDYSGNKIGDAGNYSFKHTIHLTGSTVVVYNEEGDGSLTGHDVSDLSEKWTASSIASGQVAVESRTDRDLFFLSRGGSNYSRVTETGNIVYDKDYGSELAGHDGAGGTVFTLKRGTSPVFKRYTNGLASGDTTVRVGDSNNLFKQKVNSSSYSEQTLDVSGISGVQTLYLGFTDYDVSPEDYAYGTNNGATGSGNSLYVYENSGSVGSASTFAEFSDITLT